MKKTLCALLGLILLLTFLAGCAGRGKTSCAGILARAEESGTRRCTLYDLKGEKGTPFDDEYVKTLFSLKDLTGEWNAVEDAALLISRGEDGYEIFILRPRHPSETGRLKILLRRRLALMQSSDVMRYMGEGYYDSFASAGVYEQNGYLLLLCTGDNDAAARRIAEAMKGDL